VGYTVNRLLTGSVREALINASFRPKYHVQAVGWMLYTRPDHGFG